MNKPLWMWCVFFGVVLILLGMDLGLFHKKDRELRIKETLCLSLFYIVMGVVFGLWIGYQLGLQSFAEYLTGFLVEKSLALDNIFLISVIFSSLSIPLKYQHRVLFFGILGVIILRAVMIGLGEQLITQFSWILHVFSIFMIITGIKMFFIPDEKIDINQNFFLKWMRRHLRITSGFHDQKFFIREKDIKTGKKSTFTTPLFIALLLIEFTDLIFAVDSVPAIFTITKDPYLIYTSNIFAILGLRALYFALALIMKRFYYLKFSLALVLIFIGSKEFISFLIGMEKFPPLLALGVTFGLLALGCVYSMYKTKGQAEHKS